MEDGRSQPLLCAMPIVRISGGIITIFGTQHYFVSVKFDENKDPDLPTTHCWLGDKFYMKCREIDSSLSTGVLERIHPFIFVVILRVYFRTRTQTPDK